MFHKCTWSEHSSILISTKFDEGLETPPWALVRVIVLSGKEAKGSECSSSALQGKRDVSHTRIALW